MIEESELGCEREINDGPYYPFHTTVMVLITRVREEVEERAE